MRYNVFVDESGPFTRDSDRSLVGGFITTIAPADMEARLERVIDTVNNACATCFTPDHVHMAPLLHPEGYPNAAVVEPLLSFAAEAREALAQACLDELRSFGVHFFYSKNETYSFATTHIQSRYGVNLLAALGLANEYARNSEKVFYISTRSSKCIEDGRNWSHYHRELRYFLSNQLNATVYYAAAGRHDAARIWSDVACYYLSQQVKANGVYFEKVAGTTPTLALISDAERVSAMVLKRLLESGRFYEAYRMADKDPEREEVLAAMGAAPFSESLVAELSDFLIVVDRLIQNRTTKSGQLERALDILRKIADCAIPGLDTAPDNHQLVNICLAVVEYAVACHNHLGMRDEQQDWLKIFRRHMEKYGAALGNAVLRTERELSLRNRAYNDQFNDFRFQEIVDDFQSEVDARVATMGSEKDNLTGEMCGTIGQACAFLAKSTPGLSSEAEKYLEKSRGFFLTSHRYHNMSVNYLATLHWQSRDIEKAIAALSLHPYLPKPTTADSAQTLMEWLLFLRAERADEPVSPFDALTMLRLLAELPMEGLPEKFGRINSWLMEYPAEQHPHQLLAKWMGLVYLRAGELGWVRGWFKRADKVATNGDFTILATTVPILGLWAVALNRSGGDAAAMTGRMKDLVTDLVAKSPSFSAYIENVGGLVGLEHDITNENIRAIARWMPYAYA